MMFSKAIIKRPLNSLVRVLEWATVFLSFSMIGCGSNKQGLEVPLDMPEICQGIDFNVNVSMRDVCGVKSRSYRAYKNLAEYRLLLYPKNGKIVKKNDHLELRLEKTIPVDLPKSWTGKIDFSERSRSQFLKNKYDYQEFIPKGTGKRLKIMKLSVPFISGDYGNVCYSIPPKAQGISDIQSGYAHKIEPMDCKKFELYKIQAESEN